jgi:RND family efflux transporter MFP subunit
MNSTDQGSRGGAARVFSVMLRGVLPFVVVFAGVLGAAQLIKTAPETRQKPRKQSATLVQTRRVAPSSEHAEVQVMGTVIAAKEIVLQPQVSGVIQELHPSLVPGGSIAAGEKIVTVDPADYEVAVRQAEASRARAEAQLQSAEFELDRVRQLEERQATNQKELDEARTARASALADVAAAEAALEQAKLDLSRTVLRAPFSCVVVEESVDIGSLVTPQTQLATLVGTDEYWVRTSIPVEQLRWIQIPARRDDAGSFVCITQRLGPDDTAEWSGRVVRLLGDLEPQGRMARVLVSVPNPLSELGNHPPLLIGSYVDVLITGRELTDVFRIGRDELRDGDAVWIMNVKDQLEIRAVGVVFRGREHVLVHRGLEEGERLVTSDLPSPVPGMALREAGVDAGKTEMAVSADQANGAGETP